MGLQAWYGHSQCMLNVELLFWRATAEKSISNSSSILSSCFEGQQQKNLSQFMLNVELLFWRAIAEKRISNFSTNVELLFWRATAEKPIWIQCWALVLKGNSRKVDINSCSMLSSYFDGQQQKSLSQFMLNVELLLWRAPAAFMNDLESYVRTLNLCNMRSSQ